MHTIKTIAETFLVFVFSGFLVEIRAQARPAPGRLIFKVLSGDETGIKATDMRRIRGGCFFRTTTNRRPDGTPSTHAYIVRGSFGRIT